MYFWQNSLHINPHQIEPRVCWRHRNWRIFAKSNPQLFLRADAIVIFLGAAFPHNDGLHISRPVPWGFTNSDFTFTGDLNNELNTNTATTTADDLNGISVDSTLPVLSPDELDAIFRNEPPKILVSSGEEKTGVEQPQQTDTETRPFLDFIQSMATMTQNEDVIPSSSPDERNTPNLEPPWEIKFPRATMATVLNNKATSFTPPDLNPATPMPPPLDSYSQALLNGLVAFRSCHNLYQARRQFPELSHEAFFPPSLQTIFDFHRGLTFVSSLGQLLPILVFLNELPNFPPVDPTILAVEGNSVPMVETSLMWLSRLCPFVQWKCENQLVPKARKERCREQTAASLWLYQTEKKVCDTHIMMLFLRQITGGQLANCDRCYTNSPPNPQQEDTLPSRKPVSPRDPFAFTSKTNSSRTSDTFVRAAEPVFLFNSSLHFDGQTKSLG